MNRFLIRLILPLAIGSVLIGCRGEEPQIAEVTTATAEPAAPAAEPVPVPIDTAVEQPAASADVPQAQPTQTVPVPSPMPASDPVPGQSLARLSETLQSIPRIGPHEAKAAVDAGDAFVVDVRSGMDYFSNRIEGAFRAPEQQLSFVAHQIPKDKLIITYCT